jgi:hypothetical protein
LAGLAAGCGLALGEADEAMSITPSGPGGFGGEIGAGGAPGDAGIDANLGDSGTPQGPLTYAALCGEGCAPALDAEPCELEGEGGAEPSELGGCQLAYDGESGSVNGACGEVGTSTDGMPCLDTSDCDLGLGCVGPGVCRPYCCGDLEACPSDTFCQPQTMISSTLDEGESMSLPVCVPASHCTLLEDSTCPEDHTCSIVRVDGTTSCVIPGVGTLGEPCPCAAGYVCATALNECLKLCKIGRATDCPEGTTCQGGSTTYPSGFGVCVGS